MRILSQIVGALVEAWGEVRVQKARVILSLVGVVAAVAAMSTVIALGDMVGQADKEMNEAFNGRDITLRLMPQKNRRRRWRHCGRATWWRHGRGKRWRRGVCRRRGTGFN